MRIVPASEIDAALAWPALIAALAAAFRGGLEAPARHHHAVPRSEGDATLLLMPAWSGGGAGDPAFLGVKVVSVFPANGAQGRPSVQGTFLLSDGRTGVPLAVLDGARLTLWRTAAASALAASRLARPDAARMVMVGAGALAPFLIRAHCAVRPIADVAVWARRPDAARALAGRLAGEGLPVRAVDDLAATVRQADLVSCATLSTEPLVRGDWLRAGAHLDLVGAFSLGMREADDPALARSSVWIDTPACLSEGGDLAIAIRSGAFAAEQVRGDLAVLARDPAAGRGDAAEITLFKSIGAAIEDLAAAAEVWRVLRDRDGDFGRAAVRRAASGGGRA